MQLSEFLALISTAPDFPGVSVIVCESDTYPASFLSQIITSLKSRTLCGSLDTETHKIPDIKAQLETSFLGSRMLYWVRNTHQLDAATKKAWHAYVARYEGPHCILYWSGPESRVKGSAKTELPAGHLCVEIAQYVDIKTYSVLSAYFYPEAQLDQAFARRVFDESGKITVDEACLLLAYQNVVGRKSDAFFGTWLSRIIVPEKSLFTLSQHLFARQQRQFLQQWKAVKDDFPDEFWVAYWSEQLWQATLFVMRARTQGYDAAKKSAYRLPFSFMNKDWQKHTQESLTWAHQFLCKLDYNLKNSAGTHGIELWYYKFLTVG